jgi:hypothetical protein
MGKLYEFVRDHGWCQGAFFRDASGRAVWPRVAWSGTPQAVAYCPLAACGVVYGCGSLEYAKACDTLNKYTPPVGGRRVSVEVWNDQPGRTKEEVLDLIRNAGL